MLFATPAPNNDCSCSKGFAKFEQSFPTRTSAPAGGKLAYFARLQMTSEHRKVTSHAATHLGGKKQSCYLASAAFVTELRSDSATLTDSNEIWTAFRMAQLSLSAKRRGDDIRFSIYRAVRVTLAIKIHSTSPVLVRALMLTWLWLRAFLQDSDGEEGRFR